MTASKAKVGRIGPPMTSEQRAERELFKADNRYVDKHWGEIKERYPKLWIAVRNAEVVATGQTPAELLRAIAERGLRSQVTVVRYVEPEELWLIL